MTTRTSRRALLCSSMFRGLYGERKLGIFPSLRGYIKDQSLYGGSLEFFQVPVPSYKAKGINDVSYLTSLGAWLLQVPTLIQGVKLAILLSPRAYLRRARNYSKYHGLQIGRKVYIRTRISLCSSSSQSHISLHIFLVFLFISYIFLHISQVFLHCNYSREKAQNFSWSHPAG